ncbi:hypothetical protein Pan14r_10630 [Crateriforma conspicua]|uniref:HIT domain-containing protein n=1 Tax=Crateriforma conspicua TaxID=2527996 RepID=A0A5C5XZF1_9PLAN|nr:hypothetical protein Pan14r_10630 [Crateriforma conspicua]
MRSRIVLETDGFVALPTIGQLFSGSMLILPRRHTERFSDLSRFEIGRFDSFARRLFDGVGSDHVLFEHGARCVSRGGCGIYHAHVHCIPVPSELLLNDMLPFGRQAHDSLSDAWKANRNTDEYIVARDSAGRVASIDEDVIRLHGYGSQHMRRVLVSHFSLPKPWDWRDYEEPERDLIAAVAARTPSHVF